jgi:hypothetical protein
LLHNCTPLIIPVVNDAFHENYSGKEDVAIRNSEHYINTTTGEVKKRISDASFVITDSMGKDKTYHIECESRPDKTILMRLFEYDSQIALDMLDEKEIKDDFITLKFPHTAMIALRHTEKTPDSMTIRVEVPGDYAEYKVPVVKIQNYSLEEMFEKKLFFYLPFYIFNYEDDVKLKKDDEGNIDFTALDKEKLDKIIKKYKIIKQKLEWAQIKGQIDDFQKISVVERINSVMAALTEDNYYLLEGVKKYMGGRILESEANNIRNEGINIGLDRGRNEGREEGRKEGMEMGVVKGIAMSVTNLMTKKGFSIDEAMDIIGVDENSRKAVTTKIKEMKSAAQEDNGYSY